MLRWLCDRFPLHLSAPAGVPDAWWAVDQRATAFAARELAVLAIFALFIRLRGLRLVDLGFRESGTRGTWLAAFALLAVGLLGHPFVRTGPYPFEVYALYAGVAIGVPVAILEECVYRGFAVRTLQDGGFGLPAQVIVSGFAFGIAHIGYIGTDWTVPVFTGVLGCLWSWIYAKAGNSLWPTLVTHAINDAVIMPYFYFKGTY
jgi:hypothetical protein